MKEEKGIQFTRIVSDMVELKKCSKSPQSYKNHMHQELSLGIIREGSTTVKFPGETIEFIAGDGVIIPPKLSHMCSPEDIEHWRFDMLYINPDFYGQELHFTKALRISDARMIEEFLTLQEEAKNQEYVKERLIELLEFYSDNNLDDKEDSETSKTNIELQINTEKLNLDATANNIKDYIENHWLKKISLEELEEVFKLNKFTLIRCYRKKFNTTPMAYQLQLKMIEAKKMLMLNKSILDVCYELGFYDQAHFTREFKKMNGLTPMAYQESINK